MDHKKWILVVGAGITAVCLFFFGWIGIRIRNNTKDVREAAEEFTSLLQNGELDALKLRFYAYSEQDPVVFADEEGTAQVQLVTEQQLADRYGAEAVQGSREASGRERLLQTLMNYSTAVPSTGITIGQSTVMQLALTGPDLMGWFENMTIEEAEALGALSGDQLEELERRLKEGGIPVRSVVLEIPMVRQNGKWRFEVSIEMESAFYGDLYEILNSGTRPADDGIHPDTDVNSNGS